MHKYMLALTHLYFIRNFEQLNMCSYVLIECSFDSFFFCADTENVIQVQTCVWVSIYRDKCCMRIMCIVSNNVWFSYLV